MLNQKTNEVKEHLFLTENGIYESEAGEFEIFIGKDSSTDNKASFVLKK